MSQPNHDSLGNIQAEKARVPLVGIPHCFASDEPTGKRTAYERYVRAIELAGGEALELSLHISKHKLNELAESADAFLLPGSDADVNPELYGATRQARCEDADEKREQADFALLAHALSNHKPVLGICYGIQSLNVFLGGTLIQDIDDELKSPIIHQWTGRTMGVPEPFHEIGIEKDSRLARISKTSRMRVNSSHHQSVAKPGRGLRVVARSQDGVIEAVEWTGEDWVVGVQWHPERMLGDPIANSLFQEFVAAARGASASLRAWGDRRMQRLPLIWPSM